MFKTESVSDFMYDAGHDLAVGAFDADGDGDGGPEVWESIRDLIADLALEGVDTDALYDLETPEELGEHVAVVLGNLWDDEGFIGFVPSSVIPDEVLDDLEACNGKIYDDQRDDTDWDTFPAALRLAAACGSHETLEDFTEAFRETHASYWSEVEAFARENFGCLVGYGLYRDGAIDEERILVPLGACYTVMLGVG